MNTRFKKRMLASVLSLAMLCNLGFTSVMANAVEGGTALGTSSVCTHHTHNEDCGYARGEDCNHEHTDECNKEIAVCVHTHTAECYPPVDSGEASPPDAAEATECPHICGEDCVTTQPDCKHTHDDACGFADGVDCTFAPADCLKCNPKDSGVVPKQEQCSCTVLCAEGKINPDCPICSAEGADLSGCIGAAARTLGLGTPINITGMANVAAIQTAIETALNTESTVTVTGTYTTSETLTLNIPEGKTVDWQANYTSEHLSAITVNGNGALAVTAGTITATQYAIYANHDAAITVSGNAVVTATGAGGKAIFAEGGNAVVTVSGNGKVEVTGEYSNAIYALGENATVIVSGGAVSSATGSAILAGGENATVTVSGGTVSTETGTAITTMGTNAAVAVSSNGNVKATGERSYAIYTTGDDATVTISGGAVSASTSNAIYATGDDATVTISSGSVSTTTGNVIFAGGESVTVIVEGGTVSTETGTAIVDGISSVSTAITVRNSGRVEATGAGGSAIVALAENAAVTVSGNAVVKATGKDCNTIYARGTNAAVTIAGGVVSSTSIAINTIGANAEVAVTGGVVSSMGIAIYTEGESVTISSGMILGNVSPKSELGWKVYGTSFTPPFDIFIPDGKILTIPTGTTLTIPADVTLQNTGTIDVYGTLTGTVSGNGTVNYYKAGENIQLLVLDADKKPVSTVRAGDTVTLKLTVDKPTTRAAAKNKAQFYLGSDSSGTRIGAEVAFQTDTANATKLTATVDYTIPRSLVTSTVRFFVEYGSADLGGGFLLTPGTASGSVTAEALEAVARVVSPGGTTTDYASAGDATQAASPGGTVTLLRDSTEAEIMLVISKAMTLDLNGNCLTMTHEHEGFLTVDGLAHLTVKDSVGGGSLVGNNQAVWVRSGKLTVESGHLEATEFHGVYVNGGTVEIKGGSFKGTMRALNVGSGSVTLSGGTFHDLPSGNSIVVEEGTVAGLLAPGYVYYKGETASGTVADSSTDSLDETVTVGKAPGGGGGGGSSSSSDDRTTSQKAADKAADNINTAKPGDSITLDMTGSGSLPGKVLGALAGKDVTLTLNMGGGAAWVIRGTDLPKGSYGSLNLALNTKANTIPVAVINNVTGGTKVMQLALSHNGAFGVKLTLVLETGKENSGLWANLYYYNPTTKALEYRASSLIHADGKTALPFDHASDYAVVIDTKNLGAPTFTDITNHWAKTDIEFVSARGLLTGTSKTTFSPNTGMTRGMFVTALGRLAGVDSSKYKNTKFTDVAATAYYAPYVAWAAEKGITSGTSATTFSPDKTITRQELAVFMQNYAKAMGYTAPKTREEVKFADAGSIGAFAKDAVKAMQMAGVMNGKDGNKFDPTGTATRAEVAATLHRYVELVIDPATAQGLDTNDSGSAIMYENGKAVKSASRTTGGATYNFNYLGEAALPPTKKTGTYTVQRGDSFWLIAKKVGCTIAELEALNGKSRYGMIYAGMVLKVPEK